RSSGHRPVRRDDELAERVALGRKYGADGEPGHRPTGVGSRGANPGSNAPPIGIRSVCQLESGQQSRRPRSYTGRMGRTYRADAIVLRSMRFAEADRVLHLYTAERGRVNAIAKGVRKTTSRFGGRLEPLTRAALMLHEGRGELHTVSGADIISAHAAVRERPHALGVALIGA